MNWNTRDVADIKSEYLSETNVLFITLDSCRYDTAKSANIPTIRKLGKLEKAHTHGDYTVVAHHSFFNGRIPTLMEEPKLPYYSESISQLWRINTGKPHEEDKKRFPFILEGNNIFEGYKKLGYGIIGAGGVCQFNKGSILRTYFDDKNFLYYGTKLTEEPLKPRKEENFPLNHIEDIIRKIEQYDKWFLFINCPETHYPYDIGKGISKKVMNSFPVLREMLNLRELKQESIIKKENINKSVFKEMHNMQLTALEHINKGIEELLYKIPKKREILTVICGDHGENFGEVFRGKPRWGHLFPSKEVMQVPMIISQIYK